MDGKAYSPPKKWEESEELDACRVARRGSEPTIPCNQGGPEAFGQHDISCVIGGQIVNAAAKSGAGTRNGRIE